MVDYDWHAWHEAYDDSGSSLARRLEVVRDRIARSLDSAPPGEISVLSVCAGQGRDLLGALEGHPRRNDVRALLVELDPRNASAARQRTEELGLPKVQVVTGNAARTDQYQSHAPADVVLVCGLFGNITAQDIQRTVAHCAALCRPGGTVVWTRHREEPDLVPSICDWFAENGFTLESVTPPGQTAVGVHRYTGRARRMVPAAEMFTFVGRDVLAKRERSARERALAEPDHG
jgi:ubiquinone/menaquinone biosynthesis C-methylase UbiE